MKKLIVVSIVAITTVSCTCMPHRQSESLFNGKDLTGWHVDVPKMDNDPDVRSPFIVRNGVLVSLGTPPGHLISFCPALRNSLSNIRLCTFSA